MHINQSLLHSRAPIDSSLGETIQLEKDDGTKFYGETIRIFPPTAIFKLYGPKDQYKFEGIDEISAEIHPTFTEIICRSKRVNKLTFKDGREYEITYPKMYEVNDNEVLGFSKGY